MSYKTVDKELAPSGISDKAVDGELPLSDIRVIDFGMGAIGPRISSYLADFGAEVIKVESHSTLDFVRELYKVDETQDPDRSVHFVRYNQNKHSILINLKEAKGVELAKKLVAISDAVTQNFTLGVFERLGMGYEELRKVKPDIIMCSPSFGGETGPYRLFRGHGNHPAALAGLNELFGWPDRAPLPANGAFGDHYLPFLWVTLLMAALEHRSRTGRGQFIDASSMEGCLDIMDTATADYWVNGRILKRQGNRHPAAAPHGVYRCQGEDRWCAITVFTDQEWQSFCRVLGNPAWTTKEKFATITGRLKNVEELDQLVEEWTREQTAEEVMSRLQEAGAAASVVKNARDVYEDPQLLHREHFWECQEPGMEKFTFEAPSARLSETPARFQRPGPRLGEYNEYVFFKLLGIARDEYDQLVKEKIIY